MPESEVPQRDTRRQEPSTEPIREAAVVETLVRNGVADRDDDGFEFAELDVAGERA